MKRVTLTVDLENNELFEEEMRAAVRGYAKEIARSELDKSINAEIERVAKSVIDKKLEPPRYGGVRYAGDLYQRVHKAATDAVESLENEAILSVVNAAVADKASADYDKIIHEKIVSGIDAAQEGIISEVRKLMASELLKIITEGRG